MTADDTVDPVIARELEELEAAFAAPLRELRPDPTLSFTSDLDRRAAAGFPRRRRSAVLRERIRRTPRLVPGAAAGALCAVLIAVVIVTGNGTGGNGTFDSGGGGSSSAGSSSATTEAAPQAQEDSGSSGSSSAGDAARAKSGAGADSSASKDSPSSSNSLASPTTGAVPPPAGGSPRSDSRSKRFVERSAAITLAAPPGQVADTADRIVAVADRLGGFVVSSTVTATDGASGGGGGEFVLRVPTTRLQDALAQLSRIGHVRERRQDADDITREHTSATDRLQEARAERTSLLRRLAKAVTDDETANLRAQLRAVNSRISLAKTTLSRVDNRARYANVAVSLIGDPNAGSVGPKKDDGGWSPGDAAHDALRVLEVVAGVALIVLAVALPLGVLAILAVLLGRIATRRGRERALDAV